MFDPALAAGDDDDRIDLGGVGRRGFAKRHREQREAETVEDGEEGKERGRS